LSSAVRFPLLQAAEAGQRARMQRSQKMRSRIRLIYVSVTILLSNDHKQAATKKSNVHPSGGSISALRFDKNEILDPSV